MKIKKWLKWVLGILLFLVILSVIMLFPGPSNAIGNAVGVAGSKIRSVAATVAYAGVGLLLVSFGVTALAAMPVVGIALIVVGLAMTAWALYNAFSKPSTTSTGGLQNMGVTN